MDLTEILVTAAGAVITAGVPIVIAFAVAYAKRAVAAFETSKYADAYAALDPVVQSAIETAAAEALTRAVDEADRFDRDNVQPWIANRAAEAANALGKAAGVRVDLQPSHIYGLVTLAADEVNTALDDLEARDELRVPYPGEPSNNPALGPAVAFPPPSPPGDGSAWRA